MTELKSRRAEATLEVASEVVSIDLVAIEKENLRRERKEEKRQELLNSTSFSCASQISTALDKYYLDPIIGFFFPGIGDMMTSLFGLPFLYISIFKIRSLPLTLAIIYNFMTDTLLGIIPVLGDIFDMFKKSYKKNLSLIVGYVEDDYEIIKKVRSEALKTAILIGIIGFLIYKMIIWTANIIAAMSAFISSQF